MRGMLIAGAALALAGCGGSENSSANASGNETAANTAAPAPNSDAQNQVRSLPDGQRNGVLLRAIRDAGQDCQQVEGSELIATSNNLPVYMATCRGGAVYAVAIRNDGTAQVQAAMPAEGK